MKLSQALLIGTLGIISACSSTQGPSAGNQMGNLILAEPAKADMRVQMAVARLTEILNRADIPEPQKAELYYQRGVYYDSVGLNGMAMYDFTRAVRLNPKLAEAYNFLGIHYTQQQEFVEAYTYFDSALEIDPEHAYAFLNRGIALYYGGRADQALKDFDLFYQQDHSDPYRVLWHYMADSHMDPVNAKQTLRNQRTQLDNSNWATHLVDFYLGDVSESQLLNLLTEGLANQQQLNNRLCEAYFYLGKYFADAGAQGKASNYFKAALSTNVYDFVEHRYARLELDLMRERSIPDLHK